MKSALIQHAQSQNLEKLVCTLYDLTLSFYYISVYLFMYK